jgi:hypothetical protein
MDILSRDFRAEIGREDTYNQVGNKNLYEINNNAVRAVNFAT